ncbi:class I SAM-dependent methyltransferase [Egibacter rhizosphaerae]|uniref:Class I SAM-dependent methyltransferase n=1 Tax=Egibacter rhizosphaerae TaxID=1670831 RepID=A0A411YG67_9ACTN|nr:class I SAM-dependent methyltransferase [Egibacter rhizosphaerae]QBI20218.1 class I SAM-dependent methyltransferase [Egibacter rhizosphaerae]
MAALSRHDHHRPGLGHARLTPLYDTVVRLLGVPRLHGRLLEQADVRPFCAVLEIGCGTGNLALQVKRTQPAAHVTGIDPDTRALASAQRKAARTGFDLSWDCGVAQQMPYSDGAFDRVLSSLMLHHLDAEQRRAALAEARRVLAADGSLHVVDFGGTVDHRDGFIARRLSHTARLADNYDNGLLSAMNEAGFARVTEVEQRVSRVLGRIAFYRAER